MAYITCTLHAELGLAQALSSVDDKSRLAESVELITGVSPSDLVLFPLYLPRLASRVTPPPLSLSLSLFFSVALALSIPGITFYLGRTRYSMEL